MQILVMQKGSGLYLSPQGSWIGKKHLALHFKSSAEALDYCLNKGLSEVDFVLHFEDSQWDIRVPSVLEGKSLTKRAPYSRSGAAEEKTEE